MGETNNVFLGIDPGPTNTGIAAFFENRVSTQVVPIKNRTYKDVRRDVEEVVDQVLPEGLFSLTVSMERFVPYKGMDTAHAESINQFIGYMSAFDDIHAYRSIDWKPFLCKYAFIKHRFQNPSESFDKKYSLAMAKFLFPETVLKTDHEADALCIAYCGKFALTKTKLKSVLIS